MFSLRILRVKLSLLLLFPILLLAQGQVFWQENGVCVCNERFAGGYPRPISIIRGGSESAISFYQYEQGGYYWVYAQQIDNQGNCLWTQNGIPVSIRNSVSNDFCAIEDGKGGAIVVWTNDFVGQYADQICAQRVDSNGVLLWGPNGILVTGSQIPVGYDVACVSDMRGGAIIGWVIGYGFQDSSKLFVQRIDSLGNLSWNQNGILLSDSFPTTLWSDGMISDEKGGAIIIWGDIRRGVINSDIYAQRIDSSGSILWQPEGVAICTVEGYQYYYRSTRSINSTIISWHDDRKGDDVYAQRISDSGENLWQINGIPICATPEYNGAEIAIVEDGQGGAIIAWNDNRSGNNDIYAQRIDSSGVTYWAPGGIFVNSAIPGIPQGFGLAGISDNREGMIICWQDYRHENWDIYCQRIQGDGVLAWQDTGLAVCTDTLDQSWGPEITADRNNGAIVVWGDRRPVGWPYASIYAQRVGDAVGIEKADDRITSDERLQIFPNPVKSVVRVRVPWASFTPNASRPLLKIFDVSGKLIKENEILRGVYPASFEKRDCFASARNDKRCGAQNDQTGEITTSLKGINPGIYFLQFRTKLEKFLVVK